MRILLAEDDYLNRRYLNNFLSEFGNCDLVVDGQEAFDAYRMAIESDMGYDVVCLDIIMPVVSGYQVLEYIRAYEKDMNIKNKVIIIMITALNFKSNIEKAKELGCNYYLTKPIDEAKFKNILKENNLI